MATPIDVSFRNLHPSEELRDLCAQQADRVAHHFPDVQRFDVVLANPHHHHEHGHKVTVRIEAHVPGGNNVVTNQESHEQAGPAVREAFRTLHRQLDTWRDKRNAHVKRHSQPGL
jgi:ribosomal subunit interface protein